MLLVQHDETFLPAIGDSWINFIAFLQVLVKFNFNTLVPTIFDQNF